MSINQQALIRHAFPAGRSVLVNGQGGRWWRLPVEYDLSADTAAVLNRDFSVGVYGWDNDEEEQKNPPAHRVSRHHSFFMANWERTSQAGPPIFHDSGWYGLRL